MRIPPDARSLVRRLVPSKVLEWRRAVLASQQRTPFLTWAPPGHFYSPVPTMEEATSHLSQLGRAGADTVAGVDLREAGQLDWLERLGTVNDGFPLPDGRYHVDNPSFCLGDALTLQGMLRLVRPKRLVEVGSGFSSAVTLDTREHHLDGLEVTFVEPYPALLESRLRPEDRAAVRILAERVQDVPMAVFSELEPGDVLFIDSSHVVRVGSDAQFLYGEVLPRLPAGVVVHVHDIFFPFEYPLAWVEEGRAWNEAYVLRAMLVGDTFEILFWNDWMARTHPDRFFATFPGTWGSPGGSIWLRRR
jgi:hypothetical protein